MKKQLILIVTLLTSLAASQAMAVAVNITAQSEVLTAEGQTNATGTGVLKDGVLTYELEYVIDIPIFGVPSILRVNGIIEDGAPPTGRGVATSCTGQSIVCDPIPLNEWGPESFVSGGPLSETAVTLLTTPPSASGNSSSTTWTITPVAAVPTPVSLTSYSELLSIPGTTVGTGTGELVNGVVTYEMDLVLEVEGFEEQTTIAVYGTLFDGTPPTGVSAISSCDGLSFICDTAELDTFRADSFESGGPLSETKASILRSGPSASGNTGPSTLTVAPIENGGSGAAGFGSAGPWDVGTEDVVIEATSVDGEPRPIEATVWWPARGDLDEVARRRFPLIVFSHGLCGTPDQSTLYTRGLASWGFLVVAPRHPGSNEADCMDGLVGESYVHRVIEVSAAIDWMLEESSDPDSRYSRRMLPRIGVTGHSFGGQTTLRAMVDEPRARAGVALQPAPAGGIDIRRPLMVIGAELDQTVSFETASRPSYELASGPRFLVEVLGAGHCATTDFCCELCDARTVTPDEASGTSLRYAVPFFRRYLLNDRSMTSLLDASHAPEGAIVHEYEPGDTRRTPPPLLRGGTRRPLLPTR